jgi:hypothetical protein
MKYRHHGYRDDDYRRERESRQEKREKRGPREITTHVATVIVRCWQCGHQQSPDDGVRRDLLCSHCNADLHCCRNCLHFDPGARLECRQPIEKAFRDKTIRNDCEPFGPRPVLDATGRRAGRGSGSRETSETPRSSNDPRDAFEDLFK